MSTTQVENARLKYELEGLKENAAVPTSIGDSISTKNSQKSEVLHFTRKEESSTTTKPSSLLASSKSNKADTRKSALGAPSGVKKARFADNVTTHKYTETDEEQKTKTRVTNQVLDAQQEADKVANECKQS